MGCACCSHEERAADDKEHREESAAACSGAEGEHRGAEGECRGTEGECRGAEGACSCCGGDDDERMSAAAKACLIASGVLMAVVLIAQFAFDQRTIASFAAMGALACGLVVMWPELVESVKRRSIDINVLMVVAVLGAIYVGALEEAGMVLFLYNVGEYLEGRAMRKSSDAIGALAQLAPDTALLVRDDKVEEVPTDQVEQGQTIALKPGMRAPLDGIISQGSSSFNDAAVTGESEPVRKGVGDAVYAASIAIDGSCRLQTTSTVENSTIAKIADLVADARKQKSARESFVQRFAKIYTPIVIALAIVVAVVPSLLLLAGVNLGGTVNDWIYRACELLVISCPCAFVISTPVTVVSSLARAARAGILVKGGAFFEEGARMQAIAFDKTGTLTQGTPQVICVFDAQGERQDEAHARALVAPAAALEANSTHPLAQAVSAFAADQGTSIAPASDVQEQAGCGISGTVDGARFAVGSSRWAADLTHAPQKVDALQAVAPDAVGTRLFVVALDGAPHVTAVMVVADALRAEAVQVIDRLRRAPAPVATIMLTGDHQQVAQSIAAQAHIDEVHAQLMPEDKTTVLHDLRERFETVGFVGDGINDAPSIAAASVGIAMGGAGSDAALASADVVLMADDLQGLPRFLKLSRKALAVLQQNVIMAIGIKVLVAILVVLGLVQMWAAIFADTGVMLLVVANGMRLLRAKLD